MAGRWQVEAHGPWKDPDGFPSGRVLLTGTSEEEARAFFADALAKLPAGDHVTLSYVERAGATGPTDGA